MHSKILIAMHPLYAGGWSLLNNSTSTWNISSPQFLQEKVLRSGAFFELGVTLDDKNSSQYIIEV